MGKRITFKFCDVLQGCTFFQNRSNVSNHASSLSHVRTLPLLDQVDLILKDGKGVELFYYSIQVFEFNYFETGFLKLGYFITIVFLSPS